ncbi:pyridoxamine 5'-phosphate oxidase family protein [Nocardia rhizosphaerihabitans]|uniref:Pyridoxamine 5'-phosphate oxidase n=1 Tax=Nocardia rhizosphaerihabitans TaxID=1691570 RepID=A0ABQ2K681_9NOCA|nr:pyridoxamine 5'-phosphate oxidase family protein [Nocardia rhizosphaerihabitans]GGN67564.1 pyridoxamine 5'-phosphate oxidase [Nocardia rhizosphaerihabitans]
MLPDPVDATDLNIYGTDQLPWSRARAAIENGLAALETAQFLGTVGPDGRPHSAGIGATLVGEHFYFTSGPGTHKSRYLAANPACTLSFRFPDDVDLVFEGTAVRTTDHAEIDLVTADYRATGWPAEREGDAVTAPFSAQSAGPAPWHLYRFTVHAAVGVALTDPHGATRWRFTQPS